MRGFFINTLFDSTFVLLGVVMGSAFVANPNLKVILGTMFTSVFALGISSGVSVYEAESLEREREILKIENALLASLEDTQIARSAKTTVIITALVNLITPFLVFVIYATPFVLASHGLLESKMAAWVSVATAWGILMFVGMYMGRNGKRNAILKGIEMAVLGGATFLIGSWVTTLI